MPLCHEIIDPRKTWLSRRTLFVFGRRLTASYVTFLDFLESCFLVVGRNPSPFIPLLLPFFCRGLFMSCVPARHAVDARVTHHGRILDVSWKFYGFTRGEACVLGMETFAATRMFGAFWLHGGRIVGAFLEVSRLLVALFSTSEFSPEAAQSARSGTPVIFLFFIEITQNWKDVPFSGRIHVCKSTSPTLDYRRGKPCYALLLDEIKII